VSKVQKDSIRNIVSTHTHDCKGGHAPWHRCPKQPRRRRYRVLIEYIPGGALRVEACLGNAWAMALAWLFGLVLARPNTARPSLPHRRVNPHHLDLLLSRRTRPR